MKTKYFIAKVGYGNSLLGFAIEKARNSGNSFLWIGYSDYEIPHLEGDYFKIDKDPPMAVRDLYYMTLVSHLKEHRETTRVITFSEDKIQIWAIRDPLRSITEADILELSQWSMKNPNVYRSFEIRNNAQAESSLVDELRGASDAPGCKSLPVKLIKEFSRDLIPACIDSLSVHRFLNSGTFRYLFSANQSLVDDSVLPEFLKQEEISLRLHQKASSYKESKFATFTRKYFDWLIDDSIQEGFASWYG